MALDYFDEHDQILNPAKCSKCGGHIMLNIKPIDDSAWDEHDLPQKGEEFNPAVHQWEHSGFRTGQGGVPLPPGRFEEAKARLADLTHKIVPHDGRTMDQEHASTVAANDPVRSRARMVRKSAKYRQDAEFDMMARNSGLMSREEQARADAEHQELMKNGFLKRDVKGGLLHPKQFGENPPAE